MTRVLLVDDDPTFCELLGEYLRAQDMNVDAVHDGDAGLRRALAGDHEIVVLDVMLPGRDGIDVLRELRRAVDLPVLMLTARGDDVDRIVGLELGADDYLAKPCNPREVVARIRAILRRVDRTLDLGTVDVAGLVVNPGDRTATLAGVALELTSTEFSMLHFLAARAGRSVTKADLSEHVLGRPLGPYDRSIDMHVSNLRRKLSPLPDGRDRIETIRGVGYQMLLP
ncbi:MAG: response regulator [Pseudomonadota bacterium]